MNRARELFPHRNLTFEEAKNAVESHDLHIQIMRNVTPVASEIPMADEVKSSKMRSMFSAKATPVYVGIPMASVVNNSVRVGGKRKRKRKTKKKRKK